MMGDIHQAKLRILESSLARQRETVAGAVGKVAEKIDGQRKTSWRSWASSPMTLGRPWLGR